MPRIRSVHPDLHRDRTLAQLSASAERTFTRLWCHLDDEGRGEDDLDLLKADLYPRHRDMGHAEIDRDLDDLTRHGLLIRYEVDGVRYLSAKPESWNRYQRPQKPQDSKLPPPPDDYEPPTGTLHDQDATGTGAVTPVVGGEKEGRGEGDADEPSALDPVEESFEDFWRRYPRNAKNGKPGGGGDKQPTLRTWRRLSQRKRDWALAAVDNYRAWCDSPEGAFPKHAQKWLNDAGWEQWQEPASNVHPLRQGWEDLDPHDPSQWSRKGPA